MVVADSSNFGSTRDWLVSRRQRFKREREFADYGIRIDKQLVAFVEVKRISTRLDVKHLRQVEMYAVNEGVEWMVLTNAANWKVYHLWKAARATSPKSLGAVLLSEAVTAAIQKELRRQTGHNIEPLKPECFETKP